MDNEEMVALLETVKECLEDSDHDFLIEKSDRVIKELKPDGGSRMINKIDKRQNACKHYEGETDSCYIYDCTNCKKCIDYIPEYGD